MAGHETTASVLFHTIHALACHSHVQDRLRREILERPEEPSVDELWSDEAYPYLGAVVREGSVLLFLLLYWLDI